MIVGIVGKPNVGKSAFFRALTLANAESGNFPFTTIDANSAVGYVKVKDPASDFGKVSNPREGFVKRGFRFIPIEVIDVAGLVPGAYEGKGLGNKFLDDLRQADVLIHVIDLSGSTNERGESVPINSYNPEEDVLFLEKELDYWFYHILKRHFSSIEKKIRLQGIKISESFYSVLSGLKVTIKQIEDVLFKLDLNKENIAENLFAFSKEVRKVSKPIVIACNKADLLIKENVWQRKLDSLKERFPEYKFISICAEYEWNLKKADENGFIDYVSGDSSFKIVKEDLLSEVQIRGLKKIAKDISVLNGTGVQEVIDYAVFDLLKLKPIFPGGSKLEDKDGNVIPDCFLMKKEATALDFAYRLHTDFGKNFIKAIDVKKKMMVGKDHILNFGDIIEIVSGK